MSNKNPNNKNKEEGELSSSEENYEIPTASDLDDFKILESTSAGKIHLRSTQKVRAPFVPFVITFSDDDSDSESEELKPSKPAGLKGGTVGMKENKRPNPSSVPNAQLLRPTTRHVASAMPSRSSLTQTFTSSMPSVNRNTSTDGHLAVDTRSHLKNLSTSNRELVGQEHGGSGSLNLDSNKLQDLRQKIELREKELKLKSVSGYKDNGSGSCRNYNVSDSEVDAPSKRRMVYADFTKFESKEPHIKRVKLSQPHEIRQISDAHLNMPPLEPGITSGKYASDNTDRRITNGKVLERGSSRIPGPLKSAQKEEQVETVVDLPSGTQITSIGKGVETSVTGNSRDVNKLVYPSNSSEQTKTVLNATAKKWPQKTAILSTARLRQLLDTMGIAQDDDLNSETLFDIADKQDKELEQAQEHRHKCEVEERKALRVYRKAQRALIEANARCTHLYQNVELISSHLQSLVVENPTFFQSATSQTRMNFLEHVPDDDLHDLPTSSYQRVDVFDVHNEQDHLISIKSVDGATQNEEERHAAGKLATDRYSDSDDSGSACLKDKRLANGVRYSSSGLSASTDEDEERFPFDEKPVDSNLRCRESAKVTNDELKKRSLELEATLRSQLFARLGTKASSKNKGMTHNTEPAFKPRVEHSDDNGQAETNIGNVPSSVKEKIRNSCGGNDKIENMSSQFPLENIDGHAENFSSNCASPAADPSCLLSDGKQLSKSFTVSCPILGSAYSHLRVVKQDNIIGLTYLNPIFRTCDTCNDEGHSVGPVETQSSNQNSTDYSSVEKSPVNVWSEKVGYYTSNISIDPFQPLCVFELRGKCNNDECPWQHIKDYSCRTINMEKSEILDSQVSLSNCEGKLDIGKHTSGGLDSRVLTPPTYLVSLDMMKTYSNPHGSLLGTNVQKCWQKCLSTSLVLSSRLTSNSPTEEPFLHGSDARDEVHRSRDFRSFFHRNLSLNLLDQQITDNDQVLELALLNLSQGINERKSKTEALKVLARSLKANPSSVIHWIAYLHIYYSGDYAKGDMSSIAVEHNQGSYELWLIFINTRMQPEDRLTAYNDGILALCRHVSAADGNASHGSECILDLFLQYLNFSCNSGYISRATENIHKLCSEKNSESHDLLFSSIISCFTLQDKCIFWFCCIYFTIYKKLPDTIVQRFESKKELNDLEWPSVNLTFDEKHQNELLIGMAVDSLALVLDSEALESDSAVNAAHMFAVNHVKCISVLEGIECSKRLLDNYMKSYPSCLELVLLSAQMKATESADLEFVGFEDALRNWKEDVPGIQCMWNQYAIFSFQKGRIDFAKQLMDRWFHSVWQVRYSESASAVDGEAWSSNASKIDVVFGLINLSLYNFFDNNLVEARLAIDGALKSASAENYKHCVKEHLSFLLSSEDVPPGGLLSILKNYLLDPRAISTIRPLSRKFIDDIKKPRIRNLVSSLWSDLSTDFSLVNLVLEVLYGPSLLPHLSCKLQDVVDMVESLIEIAPANYRLAISVGKLLSKDFKHADIAFAGVSFWATSLIANSLFQAVPIPPELIWIEAADTLNNLTDTRSITESFHRRALTAYPLSIQLWKSYLNFSQVAGNASSVIAAAKERGIILD